MIFLLPVLWKIYKDIFSASCVFSRFPLLDYLVALVDLLLMSKIIVKEKCDYDKENKHKLTQNRNNKIDVLVGICIPVIFTVAFCRFGRMRLLFGLPDLYGMKKEL